MQSIFDTDETDAVLLINASNVFNSMNRAVTLHNIGVLCPSIETYAINTYLIELALAEGTTQGDPLAMSLYEVSLQPLINKLQGFCLAK